MQSNLDLVDRREAMRFAATAATTLLLPQTGLANAEASRPIRFGVIADVHKGVIHDADKRLRQFVDHATAGNVDFVVQLGDFCVPTRGNQAFMKVWESFAGPRYHVLGNHDMDGDGDERPSGAYAWSPEETAEHWGMPARYYSFDSGGVHFVVLDGNEEKPGGQSGYRRWVAKRQREWLAADLAEARLPTIVFVHQSPEREGGIENGAAVRALFEQSNRNAASNKVLACFTGHHHRDYVRRINGVYYAQINSASYHWLGSAYLQDRYDEQTNRAFPYIKYTAPYKEPLFAIVTVDLVGGLLAIEGRRSEFVGPSPWEQGASRDELDAETLRPEIRGWKKPLA